MATKKKKATKKKAPTKKSPSRKATKKAKPRPRVRAKPRKTKGTGTSPTTRYKKTRLAPKHSPAHALGIRSINAVVEQRLQELDEYMAEGHLQKEAARWMKQRFGLGTSQANKYVRAVLGRWMRDAEAEPLEERRARLRALQYAVLRRCYERKSQYSDRFGKVRIYADPDLKTAQKAIEHLARFEGLVEPGQDRVVLLPEALLGKLAEYYGMGGGAVVVPSEVIEVESEMKGDRDD